MKKTIISVAVIAVAIFAASCQKENPQENNASEGSASVFTATIETVTGTKTTVERIEGTPATYKTYWESTDQISINGVTYTATPDVTDATKATFAKDPDTQTDPTGTFNAYFPANLYNNGTPTLPANVSETWADGKYNMPMYATSTTASLSFTNLCGVLKITVTNYSLSSVTSVKSITVSSTNKAVSGAFNVDDNNAAVLTAASNTANTVTVTYTEAVTTDDTDKVFYVAIPAQTYQNLSIAVSDGTNTEVMTTTPNQDITVVRNTVYPITFVGDLITTGTATRAEGEGTTDVKWVQLWAGGPKFAEYNVGAENNNAEDYGGYYTWGGTTKNGQGIEWIDDQNTGSAQLTGDTDTATKLWGSNWRMPTNDELGTVDEFEMDFTGGLLYECTCTWVKNYNGTGVNGLLCTGKGDYSSNSIFLPGAGFLEYSVGVITGYGVTEKCVYWTSIPGDGRYAYSMSFDEDNYATVNGDGCRWQGYSVRAVLVEE